MPDLNLAQAIFLTAIVLYTTFAAILDYRYRRIPNRLTVPMCLAGLIFQTSFYGWSGLQTAVLGFAAGFGILFVLWMIGSAGGGDVKLMGGLSVWLGAGLTLKVLFSSLVFVMIGTTAMLAASLLSQGMQKTKSQYLKSSAARTTTGTTLEQRAKRRVMAFAMPVALATWCVLVFYRSQLELFRNHW